ncbi:MAG TPA: PD-(D/E)XK nuclease family protein [Longimicrobiaceae bacterium]|nr:PD-(D/E)XK nuclease family protein [Longimicrobiaceae bacterium]
MQTPPAWSHTRAETFRLCRRRYFYRYHAASVGWRQDADPLAKRAYALRHLTTFDLVLGIEVHARARELAFAVRRRRGLPTADELRARTRLALNRAWAATDVRAFLRDPKRIPMLAARYYERGVGPATIERIREKLSRTHTHLIASPVWVELREAGPAGIHLVDALSAFQLGEIPVYAAPDLVFSRAGDTVIVDWKTSYDRDARAQVAVYGLYIRHVLGVASSEGAYVARVVHLVDGDETTWNVTDTELDAAEERIQESSEAMRAADAAAAGPAWREAFPLTRRRDRCGTCPFWEFCEGEIRGEEPLPA